MAVRWVDLEQEARVSAVLDRHPPESNTCDDAARDLLSVAREIDPQSSTWAIRPKGRARFVIPKVDLRDPWCMHYTVAVAEHYVDALTTAGGTSVDVYLVQHWHYPEALSLLPEALRDAA